MDIPSTEGVWKTLCMMERQWTVFFAINLSFLILSLVAFLFVDPSSASYVVLLVDVAIIVPLVLVSGVVVYNCRRRSSN